MVFCVCGSKSGGAVAEPGAFAKLPAEQPAAEPQRDGEAPPTLLSSISQRSTTSVAEKAPQSPEPPPRVEATACA
jgi:hypothetical protein